MLNILDEQVKKFQQQIAVLMHSLSIEVPKEPFGIKKVEKVSEAAVRELMAFHDICMMLGDLLTGTASQEDWQKLAAYQPLLLDDTGALLTLQGKTTKDIAQIVCQFAEHEAVAGHPLSAILFKEGLPRLKERLSGFDPESNFFAYDISRRAFVDGGYGGVLEGLLKDPDPDRWNNFVYHLLVIHRDLSSFNKFWRDVRELLVSTVKGFPFTAEQKRALDALPDHPYHQFQALLASKGTTLRPSMAKGGRFMLLGTSVSASTSTSTSTSDHVARAGQGHKRTLAMKSSG